MASIREIMRFENPTFHSGLNLTVRKGTKWRDKLEVGDEIRLYADGGMVRIARVEGIYVTTFHMLPEQILVHEHDKSCRNAIGLYKELNSVYEVFSPTDVITCVFFWVSPNESDEDILDVDISCV